MPVGIEKNWEQKSPPVFAPGQGVVAQSGITPNGRYGSSISWDEADLSAPAVAQPDDLFRSLALLDCYLPLISPIYWPEMSLINKDTPD